MGLRNCTVDPGHQIPGHLKNCPYCALRPAPKSAPSPRVVATPSPPVTQHPAPASAPPRAAAPTPAAAFAPYQPYGAPKPTDRRDAKQALKVFGKTLAWGIPVWLVTPVVASFGTVAWPPLRQAVFFGSETGATAGSGPSALYTYLAWVVGLFAVVILTINLVFGMKARFMWLAWLGGTLGLAGFFWQVANGDGSLVSWTLLPAGVGAGYLMAQVFTTCGALGGVRSSRAWLLGTATVAAVAVGAGVVASPVLPTRPWAARECVEFADVPAGSTFYNGVRWLACEGAAQGTIVDGERLFRPEAGLTRGALALFLYRLAGSPAVADSQTFVDLGPESTYFDAANWMAEQGLSTGVAGPSGTEFQPEATVQRWAGAVILSRYAENVLGRDTAQPPPPEYSYFSDVPADAGYYPGLMWLAAEGVATGWGDRRFQPNEPLSRGAAALWLYRLQV